MKKFLQVFLIALVFSSCSNVIVPYYTTVDKITEVDPGMSKDQVVETLGIAPYEIFMGLKVDVKFINLSTSIKKLVMVH